MKLLSVIFISFIFPFLAFAQEPKDTEDWSRKPEIVNIGKNNEPPSDAIVLFDKEDMSKWEGVKGVTGWKANGDFFTVEPKTGDIKTIQKFGDIQLHIEWRTPKKVKGKGQGRGNSGIFLQERYEVQVLDSYDNETYYNGQAGSIYKQSIPLVNVCKPNGEWQSYDIIFIAPRFNENGELKSPGYLTVFQNGILIQYHVELKGSTEYIGAPSYKKHNLKESIRLQDHGNPVSYRNIWVRELNL